MPTNLIKFYSKMNRYGMALSLRGKHLLVHPEQGYGDTLMSWFLNLLGGYRCQVSFAVPAPLKSLMETFETSAKLLVVGDTTYRLSLPLNEPATFDVSFMAYPSFYRQLFEGSCGCKR